METILTITVNILIVLAISVFVFSPFIGNYLESKDFNNCICKECGNKLYYTHNDGKYMRYYQCKKCNYTTWVSWWCDKKFRQ